EQRARTRSKDAARKSGSRGKVLVIDDSLMLLSFVKDILTEANYDATTAPTAAEGLEAAKSSSPDLILLDYVLPDMKGDEITKALREDTVTAPVPVVYMSAIGVDLRFVPATHPNVIGFLNKPFTSDLLIKTVETYMPKSPDEPDVAPDAEQPAEEQASSAAADLTETEQTAPAEPEEWWSSPQRQPQPLWQEHTDTGGS